MEAKQALEWRDAKATDCQFCGATSYECFEKWQKNRQTQIFCCSKCKYAGGNKHKGAS